MCWNYGKLEDEPFDMPYAEDKTSHSPDFISTIRDAIQELPYLGVFTVGENNLMCVNWLSWTRGIPPGQYNVWANECRGVLTPKGDPSAAGGFLVFPGV